MRPLCSIAVRARQTVVLKTPQLLDNTTSNYRKQPSVPNLVTPAARRSDGDRHNIAMVVPRGETIESPDPVVQRGPPDLVVIPRRGWVREEHFRLCDEHVVRIFRRILQSEILLYPTLKTHCRMNEISRKFQEFARSVKKGLGGEGESQKRRK